MVGTNTFAADYTFAEAGSYELFFHLYADDLHVTKKQQLEVQ